jgi:hypothetical protein
MNRRISGSPGIRPLVLVVAAPLCIGAVHRAGAHRTRTPRTLAHRDHGAVDRRPGRHGAAPHGPRADRLQQDAVLRRQWNTARNAYDQGKLLEDELNKTLRKGALTISVQFVPMSRSELLPALIAGKGVHRDGRSHGHS